MQACDRRSSYRRTFRQTLGSYRVVNYAGEKTSKSLGNLVFVGDIVRSYEPIVLRLALMSHHYRNGFEWDARRWNG